MHKNILISFMLRHKYFFLISLFYLFIRTYNLTKLPIFNDEAIYLDWGWREVNIPGMLFYSLYDAKQPFLMWIFGVFQNIFEDPLFAGRFVSVITGYMSLLGIYCITKEFFNKKAALFSSFFYTIVPIFSFYDRQALMESSVTAIGVWSFYYLLKIQKKAKKNYFIIIGMILGIGFFIKTSVLIFVLSFIAISLISYFKFRNKKIIKYLSLTFLTMLMTDFLLIIQPMFWQTFSSNNRYSLTFEEQLKFPINIWISNLFGNIEISFFYITPLIFIFGLIGIIFLLLKRNRGHMILVYWFGFVLFFQTIIVGGTSTRYLSPFLPYIIIGAGYLSAILSKKWKVKSFIIFVLMIIPAVGLTILQVFNPLDYFNFLSKVTRFSDSGYVSSWTSGYGIMEARDYIKKESGGNYGLVGVRVDAGNPENAIFAYFHKDKNIKPIYFDSKIIDPKIMEYDCIKADIPIYFVSRGSQLAGLEKYLKEVKRFYKPEDKEYVGVHKLKDKCLGSFFKINI